MLKSKTIAKSIVDFLHPFFASSVQKFKGSYLNSGYKGYLALASLACLGIWGFNALLKNYGLKSKKSVRGKHVFLTGAVGGLGTVFSQILAGLGAKLTLIDIHQIALNNLAQRLRQRGAEVQIFVLDVKDQQSVRQILRNCTQRLGPVDILINNAGVVSRGSFQKFQSPDFKKVIQTNFLSIFYTTRAVMKQMIARNEGHVVNICSLAGQMGIFGLSAYCSSKFAMMGLHQVMRQQIKIKNYNIKTTIISPYYIKTGMVSSLIQVPWYKPVLQSDWACSRIINAILQEEEATLIPWKMNILMTLKTILPTMVFDWFACNLSLQQTQNFR